jgi:hypothetical protein
MDCQTRFNTISKTCKEQWPKTCYTNILMFAFLLQLAGQSWEEFLLNPTFKQMGEDLKQKILALEERDIISLWSEGHGLCTFWCIYICDKSLRLNTAEDFGDQRSHYAAFGNDGVIIDSSARKALLCQPGEIVTVDNKAWWIENIDQTDAKLFSVRKSNPF